MQISIDKSPKSGRGVFAQKDFEPGETIFEIPESDMITLSVV